jgi:hypothetical protein
LVGTIDDIDALRKRRTATNWVVPKSAIPGDPVLIFLRGEGFVAEGRISSDPRPSSFGNRSVYRASLDDRLERTSQREGREVIAYSVISVVLFVAMSVWRIQAR